MIENLARVGQGFRGILGGLTRQGRTKAHLTRIIIAPEFEGATDQLSPLGKRDFMVNVPERAGRASSYT